MAAPDRSTRAFWDEMHQAAHAMADAADLGMLLEVSGHNNKTRVWYYRHGTISLSVRNNAEHEIIDAPARPSARQAGDIVNEEFITRA